MAGAPATLRLQAARTIRKARSVAGRVSRRPGILPGFIVVGAQRSGTTSLFLDLRWHPRVCPSRVKEVHFFDHQYAQGLDWYRTYFRPDGGRGGGDDVLAGEATPYYLFHPAVPERVAETLPDVRLLAILRNPVDRAFSHYRKSVEQNVERLSFEDALDGEDTRLDGEEERLLAEPGYRSFQHRHHSYVARGLYAEQLERWFALFPREQFLVVRAEDFFARPHEIYAHALDFLGLPPFEPPGFRRGSRTAHEPLDARLRERLERRFAEPNARLAELLGTPLWWPSAREGGD